MPLSIYDAQTCYCDHRVELPTVQHCVTSRLNYLYRIGKVPVTRQVQVQKHDGLFKQRRPKVYFISRESTDEKIQKKL
jgi:hypothetical protein